ncbi:MAG: hypothetical protein A3H42_02685 [Deltaproteobacteria bacterium RIFCSPLOWO2_02_FULL_46_8]|nr:MAG: hypothetical protein A3H42_02685 [Deltaproteobacteria bacterium RIFCSPLOWO2_02_FULL_46_8]
MELMPDYKVNLPEFEGPLDLLLYLIRKNDLDVYDIPISFITGEYLKYLETMRELNIDLAGEFLTMAAELMLIKSRMLLPTQTEMEEEEGLDPRAELARRLIEYQRFKMAAQKLSARPMLGRNVFTHPAPKADEVEEKEMPIQGEVFQLMNAFSDILKRLPKKMYHEVAVDRIGITDRIYQIIDMFQGKETLRLSELLPEEITRYDVVITFISLLEMTRLKMIRVHQEGRFGSIFLTKAMETLSQDENIKLIEDNAPAL